MLPKLDKARRLFGSDSGKIVVVEYGDFQCPACANAYRRLMEFQDRHREQIQFYFKHMPMDYHEMAYPSALFFEALRMQDPAMALKFLQNVYRHQDRIHEENFLLDAVREVGADTNRVKSTIMSGAVDRIIEEDMAEFNRLGFIGTPCFVVNKVKILGVPSLEELERIVERTTRGESVTLKS